MDETRNDRLYVRTADGVEHAVVCQSVDMLKTLTDMSGNTGPANTAKTLFEDDTQTKDDVSRQIFHIGTTGSIWVNFLGDDAAANTAGSLELVPGGFMSVPTRAEVSILGTEANIPYTAFRG